MWDFGLGKGTGGAAALLLALATSCGGSEAGSELAALDSRIEALEQPAAGAPERIALLVGVSDYSASGLPSLEGTRNDVELVRRLLVERFRYDEDEMLVLQDEEATHENILRAFDRGVLQRASEETEVFVYLAGHGSRIRDASGSVAAELDAFDSSFVAYDSRAGGRRGERDLSDDELRSLLEALTRKTDRVTVVTDSCHSGELVRGGPARAVADGELGLDLDWVRTIWPEGVELTEDGPGERLDESRYVHVAASRRDQSAREVTAVVDGEERSFGALTYYLVKELENAPADATWSQIIDVVAPRVRRAAHQSVTFGGQVERRVFARGVAPARGYRARATPNPEQIEVSAGFLLGLREESVLEVRDVRGEELLGRAVVERVFSDVSMARWEEAPAESSQVAFRVRELERGSAEPPLRILRAGAESLADLPLVRLVDEEELAEYRVIGTGEGAELETLDGIRIGPADWSTVETEVAFQGLRDLAGARGQYAVSVSLRLPTGGELAGLVAGNRRECVSAPILDRDSSSIVVVGAPPDSGTRHVVMIELANESEERLYAYLLSLEEARTRNLIGFEGEQYVVLEPGETRSIPVAVVTRPSWRPARPMLDRYLALTFEQRLRNPLALQSRSEITRSQGDELPGVLSRIVKGGLTRGGGAVSLSPKGWGVDFLDLLVVSAQE